MCYVSSAADCVDSKLRRKAGGGGGGGREGTVGTVGKTGGRKRKRSVARAAKGMQVTWRGLGGKG